MLGIHGQSLFAICTDVNGVCHLDELKENPQTWEKPSEAIIPRTVSEGSGMNQ